MKSLLESPAIPSFLHVFASLGGLALIAEHLPIVYHDVPRAGGAEESRRDRQSDKWADNVGFAWHAASETWAPMEAVVEEMEVSQFFVSHRLFHSMYTNYCISTSLIDYLDVSFF